MTEEMKRIAGELAAQFESAGEAVPAELRARFIEFRAELFQRGIYDPVLGRFDSATVPRAAVAEIAEELRKIGS